MQRTWATPFATPLCSALALGAALMMLVGGGCSPSGKTGTQETTSKRPKVVTTTTMLTDLVSVIAGDTVDVQGIMAPGGDPHLYQPTPGDAKSIARADLVVTHGLKLEGWIDDLVRNAGGKAQVVVSTEGITPLQDPLKTGYPDPHTWQDVSLWKVQAANVRDALVALDPDNAASYRSRAADHIKALETLDGWVTQQITQIPKERRVLVTSHDAFQYYGARYGLEVVAVQGISTESEAGARDVARIVDVIRERALPAIFVESSVSPKLIEQISRETGASIGGTLFSDSLGPADSPGGTYMGMIRENTTRVVAALNKATAQAPPKREDTRPTEPSSPKATP
ncbi:MAG: zinc ABC transporter substrate-binding protein [Myxococcota bacterium]